MSRWAVCSVALLVAAGALASSALADDPYTLEHDRPFFIRGLIDARVIQPGAAPSWVDRGPGITRYGGDFTRTGFERVTTVVLSQAILEAGASLPAAVQAGLEVNLETPTDEQWRLLVIDAHLRREWGTWDSGIGVQAGVNTPTWSLEHIGPAWTPLYSLTPAALSSWTWEEIHPAGVEVEGWREVTPGARLNLLGGMVWGTDQVERLLAARGWILSDFLSGINADLPLPKPGNRMSVFDERDGRPALYAILRLDDPRELGTAILGYFDNLGNQDVAGTWETRFATAGATVQLIPHVDLVTQYLFGRGLTRASPSDNAFHAFYALASGHYRGHRLTFRYDDFRVQNLPGASLQVRENGHAFTLAYLFEFWMRHRVAFEYIWPTSHRVARNNVDPPDDGWQLSYRFRY